MSDDLDRVRADLAAMKSVCVEPALPTEEVLVDLTVGFCGLLLAAVPWFVPVAWFKTGALVATIIGAAVYVPWKRRILKRDAARRQLETREWKISVIALLGFF